MRKYQLLIFCFSVFISILDLSAQKRPDINDLKQIVNSEKRAFILKSAKSGSSVGNNYDLKYHRFNWYLDPGQFYISGSVKSIFASTKDNVNQISFELNSNLTVDSVTSGNAKLIFDHTSNDELQITLDKTLSSAQLDSVIVYYKGIPVNKSGFGSFVQDKHGKSPGVPILWSLSEPYGAKDWWPCKSSLNDKIDSIDIIVTTPAKYRVAANGLLISETKNGANKTYHWKHRYPIAAYLIGITITNYSVFSHFVPDFNGKQLEVLNYVYPEDSANLFNATKVTVDFIQLYNKLLIPYPFYKEKYGHAEFGWPGGMEHQTMTFLGAGAFGFDVISHELAHQWFGDMITCGDWHELWLNEGFATYCSGLCYERFFHPPADIDYWSKWKFNEHAYVTSKPCGSVYVKDTANVDTLFDSRLTYSKGALILHQLRWVIGDSNFFHALQNYLNDPRFAYNYAHTSDLKAHFEFTSGMDLTEYFNDWYTGEGYPVYTINALQDWQNNIMLTLKQRQSCNSVSFFKLPVPVEFKNATRDTIITFDNTFSGQTFNFNPGFHADSIKLDPKLWLISRLDSVSIVNAVKNIYKDNLINVYPNPSNNICYLNYLEINISRVEVIDGLGKVLSVIKPEADFKSGQLLIDMKPLTSGVYMLKIFTDKGITVKKVVRE